jgi:hypothetical protein
MGVEKRTYYTVTCYKCGEDLFSDAEHSAWSDPDVGLEVARDSDGVVISRPERDLVFCNGCVHDYMAGLPDDAWDAVAEGEPDAVARMLSALGVVVTDA